MAGPWEKYQSKPSVEATPSTPQDRDTASKPWEKYAPQAPATPHPEPEPEVSPNPLRQPSQPLPDRIPFQMPEQPQDSMMQTGQNLRDMGQSVDPITQPISKPKEREEYMDYVDYTVDRPKQITAEPAKVTREFDAIGYAKDSDKRHGIITDPETGEERYAKSREEYRQHRMKPLLPNEREEVEEATEMVQQANPVVGGLLNVAANVYERLGKPYDPRQSDSRVGRKEEAQWRNLGGEEAGIPAPRYESPVFGGVEVFYEKDGKRVQAPQSAGKWFEAEGWDQIGHSGDLAKKDYENRVDAGETIATRFGINPDEVQWERTFVGPAKSPVEQPVLSPEINKKLQQYAEKQGPQAIKNLWTYLNDYKLDRSQKAYEKTNVAPKLRSMAEVFQPEELQVYNLNERLDKLEQTDNLTAQAIKQGRIGMALDMRIGDAAAAGDHDRAKRLREVKKRYQNLVSKQSQDQEGVKKFYVDVLRMLPPMLETGAMTVVPVVGQAAATAQWMRQGAGTIYSDLLDEGVDPETASTFALAGAVPYALVEKLQFGGLSNLATKVSKKQAGNAIARGISKVITSGVVKGGTTEAMEEGFQAGITEVAKEIARQTDGISQKTIEKVLLDVAAKSFKEFATTLPHMMVTAGGAGGIGAINEYVQNRSNAPLDEKSKERLSRILADRIESTEKIAEPDQADTQEVTPEDPEAVQEVVPEAPEASEAPGVVEDVVIPEEAQGTSLQEMGMTAAQVAEMPDEQRADAYAQLDDEGQVAVDAILERAERDVEEYQEPVPAEEDIQEEFEVPQQQSDRVTRAIQKISGDARSGPRFTLEAIATEMEQEVPGLSQEQYSRMADVAGRHPVTRRASKPHHESYISEVRSKQEPDNVLIQGSADLNQFKAINDSLGHDTGDEIMIKTQQAMEAVVDEFQKEHPDIEVKSFHFGGDEAAFTWYGPQSKASQVQELAKDIKDVVNSIQIEAPDGTKLPIGMSIAMAEGYNFKAADDQLNKKDEIGKNSIDVAPELATKYNIQREAGEDVTAAYPQHGLLAGKRTYATDSQQDTQADQPSDVQRAEPQERGAVRSGRQAVVSGQETPAQTAQTAGVGSDVDRSTGTTAGDRGRDAGAVSGEVGAVGQGEPAGQGDTQPQAVQQTDQEIATVREQLSRGELNKTQAAQRIAQILTEEGQSAETIRGDQGQPAKEGAVQKRGAEKGRDNLQRDQEKEPEARDRQAQQVEPTQPPAERGEQGAVSPTGILARPYSVAFEPVYTEEFRSLSKDEKRKALKKEMSAVNKRVKELEGNLKADPDVRSSYKEYQKTLRKAYQPYSDAAETKNRREAKQVSTYAESGVPGTDMTQVVHDQVVNVIGDADLDQLRTGMLGDKHTPAAIKAGVAAIKAQKKGNKAAQAIRSEIGGLLAAGTNPEQVRDLIQMEAERAQQPATDVDTEEEIPFARRSQAINEVQYTPKQKATFARNRSKLTSPDGKKSSARIVSSLTNSEKALADEAKEKIGREIVFFAATQNDPMDVNGFAAGDGTIYINRNAEMPKYTVFAHELVHSIKSQDADLYEQLAGAVKNVMGEAAQKEWAQSFKKRYGEEAFNFERGRGKLEEEMIAETIQELGDTREFWQEISRTEPGLIERILQAVERLFKKLFADGDTKAAKQPKAVLDTLKEVLRETRKRAQKKQRSQAKADDSAPAKSRKAQKPEPETGDLFEGTEYQQPTKKQRESQAQRQEVKRQQEERKGGRADLFGLPMFKGQEIEGTEQMSMFSRKIVNNAKDNPAFREWFEGSKVVDENGDPLVVYHGTNQTYTQFKTERLGSSTRGKSAKTGFYFTSDVEEAGEYAAYSARTQKADAETHERKVESLLSRIDAAAERGQWEKQEQLTEELERLEGYVLYDDTTGQNIFPVFLSIKNPQTINMGDIGYDVDVTQKIKDAKAGGYDGIILKNIQDRPIGSQRPTNQYIAFNPNQIKSAFNQGSFNPGSPDIRFSRKGKVEIVEPTNAHRAKGRSLLKQLKDDQVTFQGVNDGLKQGDTVVAEPSLEYREEQTGANITLKLDSKVADLRKAVKDKRAEQGDVSMSRKVSPEADRLRPLMEDAAQYPTLKAFKKDYEILYHGGSERVIGDKLVTGGRVSGSVTEDNLGRGQDYGGIFFTPEPRFADTFSSHAPGGRGKVHKFAVKTNKIFDPTKASHILRLEKMIGKEYLDSDGDMVEYTQQMHDFVLPEIDGKRTMDWATMDPDVLSGAGFNGAKVVENYGDGDSLWSYVLFEGGENSPHYRIPDNWNADDVYFTARRNEGDVPNIQFSRKEFRASEAGATEGQVKDARREWAENGTDSKYFKKWFGDSKVVDENGEPLVVYHGTAGGHNVFDASESGSVSSGDGRGFWFTPSLKYANEYAENAAGMRFEEPRIMRVYLRSENPLVVDWSDDMKAVVDGVEMDFEDNTDVINHAIRKRYDGIWFPNGSYTDEESFVVFEPEQIKSATDNQGTFDVDDPDIRMSRKADPFYSPTYKAISDIKQEKNVNDQIQGMIRKGQLKKAEVEWLGLEQWLSENPKASKQDVLDFVRKNQVVVEEKVLSISSKALDLQRKMDEELASIERQANPDYDEYDAIRSKYEKKIKKEEGTPPKYARHVVPGESSNYQELLFRTPAAQGEFKSSHWDDPNVFAHARVDERTTNGGDRALFMIEAQSDWAKDARERGVRLSGSELSQLDDRRQQIEAKGREATPEEKQEWADIMNRMGGVTGQERKVPNMPFLKNWHEFISKRMLRKAAEEGYDRLAWATGEQTADLYDLGKQVEEIHVIPNEDGTYGIVGYTDGGQAMDVASSAKKSELSGMVGKSLADKIVEDNLTYEGTPEGKSYTGTDLKIGGEWAKNLYDKMIPKFLSKYVKKWNSKVEPVTINGKQQLSVPITDEMRESVMTEGQPMFARKENQLPPNYTITQKGNRWHIRNPQGKIVGSDTNKDKALGDALKEVRKKIEAVTGIKQNKKYDFVTGQLNIEALNDQVSKLKKKYSLVKRQSVLKSRGQINLAIDEYNRVYRELEAQKVQGEIDRAKDAMTNAVRTMIYNYAREVGYRGQSLATALKNVKTIKGMEKALSQIDKALARKQRSAKLKYVRALIKRRKNQIERAGNKNKSSVLNPEYAAAMEQYIEMLEDEEPLNIDDINAKIDAISEGDSDVSLTPKEQRFKTLYDQVSGDEANMEGLSVEDKMFILQAMRPSLIQMFEEELDNVVKDLKSLYETGKTIRQKQLAREERRREVYKQKIREGVERSTKNPAKELPPMLHAIEQTKEGRKGRGPAKWIKDIGTSAKWGYVRPENIAEYFTGNFQMFGDKPGAVWRYVFKPMLDAEENKMRSITKHREKLNELFGNVDMSKVDLPHIEVTYPASVDGEGTVTERANATLTLNQAMFIYANSQNENNQRHLTGTGADAVTISEVANALPDDVKKAIDSLIDFYDTSIYDRMNEVYSDVYGVRMPKEHRYFPIARLNRDNAEASIMLDLMQRFSTKPAAVEKGMTKKRVKSAAAFDDLDFFKTIFQHMNQAEHYLAYEKPVNDVRRVMLDKQVKKTMKAKSEEAYNQLNRWLKDVTSGRIPQADPNFINKWADYARKNFSVFALGLNPRVMLKQAASFAIAGSFQNPGTLMSSAVKIVSEKTQNMGRKTPMVERMHELSPFMANRASTMERDIQELVKEKEFEKFFGLANTTERLREIAMSGIQNIDLFTTAAIWNARFEESLGKGRSEKAAAREADMLIRRTQPAGGIVNLPGMFRQKGIVAAFTMFQNQINQHANLLFSMYQRNKRKDVPESEKLKYAAQLFFGLLASSTIIYMVNNAISPFKPEESAKRMFKDDPEGLAKEFIIGAGLGSFAFANVLAGDALDAATNRIREATGRKAKPRWGVDFSPSIFGSLNATADSYNAFIQAQQYLAMGDIETGMERLGKGASAAAEVATATTGLPFSFPFRSAKGVKNVKDYGWAALVWPKSRLEDYSVEANVASILDRPQGWRDAYQAQRYLEALTPDQRKNFMRYVMERNEATSAKVARQIDKLTKIIHEQPLKFEKKRNQLQIDYQNGDINAEEWMEAVKKVELDEALYYEAMRKQRKR